MAFTANEMVTAISNSVAGRYMEDRFERASFAAWLASEYLTSEMDAAECISFLAHSEVWCEDGNVTRLYRDLMDYREAATEILEITER